jgi:hypothetical protein
LCFLLGVALNHDLPTYASHGAGITDMYHHAWLQLNFIYKHRFQAPELVGNISLWGFELGDMTLKCMVSFF